MNVAEIVLKREGRENMLKQLAEGEEIYWDLIVKLVELGRMTCKEAFQNLLPCLEKKIVEFSTFDEKYEDEVSPKGYWQKRLDEALKSYNCLVDSNCPDVSYRGFTLPKNSRVQYN